MKKTTLILALLLGIAVLAGAKTTYIPTYYTQINIQGEGASLADSTARREMYMMASDGRYSITVLHDSVTAERVKAIKRMKAASGWAIAATVMSGVSASLNPMHTSWDAVRYTQDMHNIASSTMLSVAAKNGAESLQKVNVGIVIENLSDREMVVNDMERGLTWFVPAHNYINLNVGNPEVNKFRIAYADCQDQKKDYVTIQAANYLEKHSIEYEDDDIWIYPVYKQFKNPEGIVEYSELGHYEQLNKVTFEKTILSIDDWKNFKKQKKAEEKKK